MEQFRLRVRIGAHDFEFEAEGERATVVGQFDTFRELVESIAPPAPSSNPPALSSGPPADATSGDSLSAADNANESDADAAEFRPIFRDEKDVLSLSAQPDGDERIAHSALLLVFGYRLYRGMVAGVSSTDLLAAIKRTGFQIERVDRLLAAYVDGPEPLLMRTGQKRGTKYRLNNRGLAMARQIAEKVKAMVV